MEPRLVGLHLILEHLGVDSAIASLKDRVRVQKAMYLAQVGGIDLGYRYGWYVHGPYSPKLTKDYFALAEDDTPPDELAEYELRPAVAARLDAVKPLLTAPDKVDEVDWLEAVASVHYLVTVSRKSLDDARATFESKKNHIAHLFDDALAAIQASPISVQAA